MARIIQYIPNYVSGLEIESVEFNSTDELFEIPFVKKFTFSSLLFGFHHFSYADYLRKQPEKRYIIIAEYDKGKVWDIVGFTDENEIIKTLPRWTDK